MTFLKVLLAVLVVLWLLSLIRLGAVVRYGPEGLAVTAIAGPLRLRVFPVKRKKRKKPKKEKPEKKRKPPKAKEKPAGKPGTLARLMRLLPVVVEAAGALKRKIRIDDLELSLAWGGGNAADAAIGYGRANAAIGMIWPVFDHNFKVKNFGFHTELDYGRTEPAVDLYAAVTITVGQAVAFGLRFGIKALRIWSRNGDRSARQQGGKTHE